MSGLRLAFGLAFLLHAPVLRAIEISIYYEDPKDPLFSSTAMATIEKAASDLSDAITTTLSALDQTHYEGTSGGSTASVNWSLTRNDPNTGLPAAAITTFNFSLNEIRLFVGARPISGSTLGLGGPGGAGTSAGISGPASTWAAATDQMVLASDAGMLRGGPELGSISGTFTDVPFTLQYGYAVGTLALSTSKTWNIDYNQMPTAGENDLYSVALHEMVHAIGFGIGDTWQDHVNGTDWTGANVAELYGTGVNVLTSDGVHIAEGLTGVPFIDGTFDDSITQEALMDPTIVVGTRKYLTDLDLAFLEDMGWDVIPEPTTNALLGLAGALVFVLARRRTLRSH